MLWGRLSQACVQPSGPLPYRFRARSISRSLGLDSGMRAKDSLAFSDEEKQRRELRNMNFLSSFDKLNHFWTSFALTCLEEVPLGVILSITALLWREEETHSTHLAPPTHTHTPRQTATGHKGFGFCSAFMRRLCDTMRLVHVGNNRLQHLPNRL